MLKPRIHDVPRGSAVHFGWALVAGRSGIVLLLLIALSERTASTMARIGCLVLGVQSAAELFGALLPPRRSNSEPLQSAGMVTAIVSAKLDNETTVLLETLHRFHQLKIPTILASNGSQPELETALRKPREIFTWNHDAAASGKAANVLRAVKALPKDSTYVLLADADTHPHTGQLASFDGTGTRAIVQYPRLIRLSADSTVERLVAMEFAIKSMLTYRRRSALSGTAYLGGSAAILSTRSLAEHGLAADALVEDIDFSLRCSLAGEAVEYRTDATFTELAPSSVRAWLIQRRRWAAGWLQLCSSYLFEVVQARLPLPQRMSWIGLLAWRRLVIPLAALAAVVGALRGGVSVEWGLALLALAQASAIVRIAQTLRRDGRLIESALGRSVWESAIAYATLAIPYTVILWAVDIVTLIAPVRSWRVTPRYVSRRPSDGHPGRSAA